MSQDTDERLLVEAAQRDPSRFGDLYERNFYRVYAYTACRVGDRRYDAGRENSPDMESTRRPDSCSKL